jgi:tetratricopeptide (TPR) repeat protein
LGWDKAKSRLEEANKYIFVKMYAKGAKILDELLEEGECKDDLLIHLRRIELAVKLRTTDDLLKRYQKLRQTDEAVAELALIMLDQQSDRITPADAIIAYQDFIKKHGAYAAAYYGIGFSLETLGSYDRAILNYDECLKLDPSWYPAYFGLSQLYYHMQDEQNGDRYFFLFEELAPYNVYGNFATHKKLAEFFFYSEMYYEAEVAVTTLGEWWIENKGVCPSEIQIYESFFLAKIREVQGQPEETENKRAQGALLAQQILEDKSLNESVLYFVARTIEEFGIHDIAVKFYKKILSRQAKNSAIVQQIYSKFFSMGDYQVAKEVFEEASREHADSPDIRFGLLMANLNLAKVNIEQYLLLKERIKQYGGRLEERMEYLTVVKELISLYSEDPDVHAIAGELYLSLGEREQAKIHFAHMYRLDPYSRISRLKYAEFEMQYGDLELGKEALDGLSNLEDMNKAHLIEVHWLRAAYCYRAKDYEKSRKHLINVFSLDPWNISYLVLDCLNMGKILGIEEKLEEKDTVLEKLQRNHEANLDWTQFDAITRKIRSSHHYELAYCREKLRFLYAAGDIKILERLVTAAVAYNPSRGVFDFLRLINTNFDSPYIYWAIGTMAKEGWQLETACSWYEQVLLHPAVSDSVKSITYIDLADCYVWRNDNLNKAVEYVKLAMDLGMRDYGRAYRILAHANLRMGQVREAQKYLVDPTGNSDFETLYLRGLLNYRNGSVQKAKEIWKPLISVNSSTLRFHYIKQEILKYYYDRVPYMKNVC